MIDAYKIGVAIALTDNVSAALRAMSGNFRVVHADADRLARTMKDIKVPGVAGAVSAAAGLVGLDMLKGPLEEAKKFEQQVTKFKLFGLGDQVTQEAAKYARAMNVMGSSSTENMRLMNEAQGVFREAGLTGSAALEGTKLAAPMLAKINFATEALGDESKAKMRTQSMAMLRFIEMRGGLQSPEKFNQIANAGWKAIQSSGGNINWEQLRQFMSKGATAALGISDDVLFGKLEPIIGQLKGGKAGDALMTAYNRLVGGVKVPNQVAHLLADSGIWDASKVVWNNMGGIKTFKGNPLKDMDLLAKDPIAFYEKDILPIYAGMNGGKGLSAEERLRENTWIFGRTGGLLFNDIDRQMATIHKSVAANAKALGVEDSAKAAGDTLAGKEIDYQAKWNSLMLELGNAILPIAVPGLQMLVDALHAVTGWTKQHGALARTLVVIFAGLSAAATIGGGLLLFTAAFKGLGILIPSIAGITRAVAMATSLPGLISGAASAIGAGLVRFGALFGLGPIGAIVGGIGLVVAGAYLVYANWDAIKPKLLAVWDGITSFFSGLGDAIMGGLHSLWGKLKTILPSWIIGDLPNPVPGDGGSPGSAASPALIRGSGLFQGAVITPPPPQPQRIVIENNLHLDGRVIARNTAEHLYNDMNRAPSSGGGFDGRQSFTPSAIPAAP